jgi:hypothetical protein
MDKRDLLRSFSKVHNKKISLLEQESDPRIADAEAALGGAKFSPDPGSPYLQIGQLPDGKQVKLNPNNGKLSGPSTFQRATYQNGKLSLPSGKSPEDAFSKLLGYIVGEGSDSSEPEVLPVIDTELDSKLLELGVDVNDPIAAAPFKQLYDNATKAANNKLTAKRLVGSLLADFPVVVREGDFYRIEPRESDIERATQLANVINDGGSDEFCGRFKKTDQGDMVVYTDFGEGSAGTVFNRSQAKVLSIMTAGCDDLEEINVIQEAADQVGGESNIRGNVLEYPPDLFALARTYLQNNPHFLKDNLKKH